MAAYGETKELNISWHHIEIIEHLEALARGEIRNLVINVPPRHSKSLIVNVAFPAWLWTQQRDRAYPLLGPQVSFLSVSFAAHLAERFGLKMLNLVNGYWYKQQWGHQVKIAHDQQSRADFANLRGGERVSASVEAGILGRGADIQILDDPHNVEGAESAVQRQATLTAVSESLSTRVTDPRISARVLIMQRLHHEDVTDWALEHWPRATTVHLMFPVRFDPDMACEQDHRRVSGEALWPALWSEEEVAKIEVEVGPYAFAGQYMQTPSPREGAPQKLQQRPLAGQAPARPAERPQDGQPEHHAYGSASNLLRPNVGTIRQPDFERHTAWYYYK
jgi:hypothetical protein